MRFNKIAGEINALTTRAAMGLPEAFTRTEFDSVPGFRAHDIAARGKLQWAEMVSDPALPQIDRYIAGIFLAVAGDPRIQPLSPSMVELPGGHCIIGTPWSDVDLIASRYSNFGVQTKWIRKECPEHQVRVQPFRVGKYPVTNCEYLEFLKDNPAAMPPTSWAYGRFPLERSNHPVFTVLPQDADAYCTWLSEKTGRAFRLLTEVEWEYAAAGTLSREFPWGDDVSPDRANTLEENILGTTPVGMFPRGATRNGILDLAGNVEEYVSSSYLPYPGGQLIRDDLFESGEGCYRIARGGAFNRFVDMARTRRRHGGPIRPDFYAIGFRLAESSRDHGR